MGTSSTPSVRVILGTDPEMSYPATNSGENWTAAVKVPEGVEGTYSLRVEVLLNNRMFTPITKSVSISRAEAPAEMAAPSVMTPDAVIAPAPIVVHGEPVSAPIEMPKVVAKMPEIRKKAVETDEMIRREIPATIAVDIPAAVVPKKTQGLSMLKSFADKPAKKMYERIVTDMPKKGTASTLISVSIASVDAITRPTKAKIAETVQASKSKPKAPIKLIKEHFFYE